MEKFKKFKSHLPNSKIKDEHWSTYPHWSLHTCMKTIFAAANKYNISEALRFISLFLEKEQFARVLLTERVVTKKDIVHTLKLFKAKNGFTRNKTILIDRLVELLYGESLHQHQERNE